MKLLRLAAFVPFLAACGTASETPVRPNVTLEDAVDRSFFQGILLKAGTSDNAGMWNVNDDPNNEMVTVVTLVEQEPLPQTHILYFDHNQEQHFEAYLAQHPQQPVPFFHIFQHNSRKELSLTSNSFQFFEYTGNTNENSHQAAANFVSWAQAGWDDYGCRTRQELDGYIDGGVLLLTLGSRIFSYATTGVDTAVEYAKDQLRPDQQGRIHHFIPLQHGFRATTTLTMVDLGDNNGCYDGNNNNNAVNDAGPAGSDDERSDAGEAACQPTNAWASTACIGNTVRYIDNCNNVGEIVEQCSPQQQCLEAQCIDNTLECEDECDTPGQQVCQDNTSWKGCSNYDNDNCLEFRVQDCSVDEYCDNGVCVETSSSCNDECTYDLRECVEDNWRECGNYDDDACTEWSEVAVCDYQCDNGSCVEAPRFEDLQNGAVYDNETGRTWQKTPPAERMNWQEAVDYCANLSLGGSSDWILPYYFDISNGRNINCSYLPSFPDNTCGTFWTSQDCNLSYTTNYRIEFFVEIHGGPTICYDPEDELNVRCVREDTP